MGDRRDDTGAPHLKCDAFENGRRLLGGKFECDRKTRCLAGIPEGLLERTLIYLYNDAVYPILLMSPLALPLFPIGNYFVNIVYDFVMRIYFETKLPQIFELLGLARRKFLRCRRDIVHEHIEFA